MDQCKGSVGTAMMTPPARYAFRAKLGFMAPPKLCSSPIGVVVGRRCASCPLVRREKGQDVEFSFPRVELPSPVAKLSYCWLLASNCQALTSHSTCQALPACFWPLKECDPLSTSKWPLILQMNLHCRNPEVVTQEPGSLTFRQGPPKPS